MDFKGKWNIDFDKHQTVITNEDETKAIAFLPIASPETKANALLISKAPEMLEMLQSIIQSFEGDYVLDGEIVDNPYEWLIEDYIKAKKLIKESTEIN